MQLGSLRQLLLDTHAQLRPQRRCCPKSSTVAPLLFLGLLRTETWGSSQAMGELWTGFKGDGKALGGF